MSCRVQSVSFKDELIFSTPESVRPISFLMALPGLSPQTRPNGDIALLPENGGDAAFILPAPFLQDSSEENVTVQQQASHRLLQEHSLGDQPDLHLLEAMPLDCNYIPPYIAASLDIHYPISIIYGKINTYHFLRNLYGAFSYHGRRFLDRMKWE